MAKSDIEHVVIIVKENHTFDNYFGAFPGVNGMTLPPAPNPPPSDHPHTHEAWLELDKNAVKQQYGRKDLYAYWSYAQQFTLCDNYFTDVAGPSTPNHIMLITADSPIINNVHKADPADRQPPFDLPSLPQALVKGGKSWRNYGGYAFEYIKGIKDSARNVSSTQFVKDAKAGKLPAVSWVYAAETNELYGDLSEHPPGNVTHGMEWTVKQIEAIVEGGLWEKSAIFITWDDWGGWYDHVKPPEAEKWKDGTQFRYGSRVPCLVLGPYAKPSYISKQQHSHVSIVAFCERLFGLPPLNKRDKQADAMDDCFDFEQKPLTPPDTHHAKTGEWLVG